MAHFRSLLPIFLIIFPLVGCNAGYYLQGGYEQGKVLLSRRYIRSVLFDDQLSAADSEKLHLAMTARRYAAEHGYSVGGAYNTYVNRDQQALTWVVMGSKPDSFSPYEWEFPVVGKVPYKGFFDQHDAESEGRRLEAEGYESYIRSTDAFSSLGWFDDPVLSTMLKQEPHQFVDTLFHELFHRSVWIPGFVDFNETAANFAGGITALRFFSDPSILISTVSEARKKELQHHSKKSLSGMYWFEDGISRLYQGLSALYQSEKTKEQKLNEREEIYRSIVTRFFPDVPETVLPKKINNSAILQAKIYYTQLKDFQQFFIACERSIPRFISGIQSIRHKVTSGELSTPFDGLLKGCESNGS